MSGRITGPQLGQKLSPVWSSLQDPAIWLNSKKLFHRYPAANNILPAMIPRGHVGAHISRWISALTVMALCVGQATAKDRLIPKDQEAENRAEALDDLRFAKLGEQWPEHVRLQRIKDGRPCWSQGMTGLQSLWITVTPSFIILGLSR